MGSTEAAGPCAQGSGSSVPVGSVGHGASPRLRVDAPAAPSPTCSEAPAVLKVQDLVSPKALRGECRSLPPRRDGLSTFCVGIPLWFRLSLRLNQPS